MTHTKRWVVDTNALISRLLLPNSITAKAVNHALQTGDLFVSNETLAELAEVLQRPTFNKYISAKERLEFFEHLGRICIQIEIIQTIKACRDTKDDKFLSVAVNGQADAILTGDKDLLTLSPFLEIPILAPSDYLKYTDGI